MKRYLQILSATFLIVASAAAQDSSRVSQLSEVVVTGQFGPQSLKNSVYQLRVVSQERLRLSGALNVQQALRMIPGIRFSNDLALGTSDISINGNSGRTVKILIDGMPAPDFSDFRAVLNQIDINSIERMEIVEGPMATIYGSDAMAGVINFITKKGTNRKWDVSARAQEETAGEEYYPFSFQGSHMQSVNAGTKLGGFSIRLGATHNEHNGFAGDQFGRNKTWLPKEQWLGNAMLGFQCKSLNLYYRIDALREDIIDRNKINIDPDPASLTVDATDQRFRSFRFMHQLQGSYKLNSSWDFNGAVSYTNYERTTQTVHRDFLTQVKSYPTASGLQDTSNLQQVNIRATAQYGISEQLKMQAGVDFAQEEADGQRILANPVIADLGLFISGEWSPIKKLNLRPSVRFVHNSVYDAPPAIPAINAKYALNAKTDIRAAYGRGYRAPALRELYFIFVDANHNIYGNPDLKAEKSNSVTASVVHRLIETKTKSYNITIGGFFNDFKDQITLGLDENDPAKQRYSYFNVDRTKNIGFNVDNQFIYKNLRVNIGGNYIATAIRAEAGVAKFDDRDYLWSPELVTSLTYRLNKIKTDFAIFYKYTGAKPLLTYQSANVTPGLYVTQTAGYHLADFTVTKTLLKYFTVNGGVRNIFDVTNVRNTAVNGGVHTPNGSRAIDYGRSYFLGLNFQLSK